MFIQLRLKETERAIMINADNISAIMDTKDGCLVKTLNGKFMVKQSYKEVNEMILYKFYPGEVVCLKSDKSMSFTIERIVDDTAYCLFVDKEKGKVNELVRQERIPLIALGKYFG